MLEVIQRSAAFLARKGIDSPRLQAELLLAQCLGVQRMQLYLNFERVLSEAELARGRELVQRRGRHEPLQYILGSTSFCGLEIVVNRHVLIPRPETELLAESGWKYLNSIAKAGDNVQGPAQGSAAASPDQSTSVGTVERAVPMAPSALDFGTGSGAIAIALAVNCPAALIQALDTSPQALDTARENAARHRLADRIRFHLSDGFSALIPDVPCDLLVANPPYIPTGELDSLQPEVRDYEPRQALDGGPDGLAYYRRLAAEAWRFLKPGGEIILEFGDGQEQDVGALFTAQKWIVQEIVADYTQRPRILIARR